MKFLEELRTELTENILPFHANVVADPNGGFYGHVNNDLSIDKDAPRGVIQLARTLYSYARAYRVLNDNAHLKVADSACSYLTDKFLDKEHGGYYWLLDAQGEPQEKQKFIYAQAFCVYGLSEYYLATKDNAVLEQTMDLYKLMEKHGRLPSGVGYREGVNPDWSIDEGLQLDDVPFQYVMSNNTLLHVLEGYTNLLKASKDPSLLETLKNLTLKYSQSALHPETGHMCMHFDASWQALSDNFLYGHDLESSWLMWEAAATIGDEALKEAVRPSVLQLTDLGLSEGIQADGGIPNSGNSKGVTSTERHWWPQTEALVGFANAYALTKEERYLDAVQNVWMFIQDKFIDKEHGEWFFEIDENGQAQDLPKAGMWKSPYHNVRACIEVLERIEAV